MGYTWFFGLCKSGPILSDFWQCCSFMHKDNSSVFLHNHLPMRGFMDIHQKTFRPQVMTTTTLIKKMSAILFIFPLHWSDIIDMLTEQIYIWIGARVINNLGDYCGRLMPAACCRLRFMCLPSDESCTGHGRLMFHNSVLVPQLLDSNTHMCAWIIPTRT